MNTEKRLSELKSFMEKNDIALSIVTRPENIYYLSNFLGISWSRPISFILTSKSTGLIIPGLEEEHAKAEANVDKIYVYYEYPEKYEMSFLEYVDRILSKYPNGTKIGVEFDVMSFGLADYIRNYGYELVDIGKKITEMRFVKDKQEIELMIEAGRLVSLALSKSLEHARTGLSELEVEQYGNDAVLREIAVKYPDSVLYNLAMTTSGIVRTVMPNVSTTTRKLEQNDIIIHSRQIGFNGYRAECERTFFVGKPTDEQKELFRIATEAQRVAMDIIRPGLTAKEVDLAARKVIQKAGYGEYAVHRLGHGLGLSEHEEPYLRFDNDLVLEEGMAFSLEPGIYVPGIGGFRHSDTVILTKDGKIVITEHPNDLNDLIF